MTGLITTVLSAMTWQNIATAVLSAASGLITVYCVGGTLDGRALICLPLLAAWVGILAAIIRAAR